MVFMTDKQRADMLANRWFIIRCDNTLNYHVRRMSKDKPGEFVTQHAYLTSARAQREADKLNAKE